MSSFSFVTPAIAAVLAALVWGVGWVWASDL